MTELSPQLLPILSVIPVRIMEDQTAFYIDFFRAISTRWENRNSKTLSLPKSFRSCSFINILLGTKRKFLILLNEFPFIVNAQYVVDSDIIYILILLIYCILRRPNINKLCCFDNYIVTTKTSRYTKIAKIDSKTIKCWTHLQN